MLYRVHLTRAGFQLTTLVVIDTDCIGSCKSNYHKTTTDDFYKRNIAPFATFINKPVRELTVYDVPLISRTYISAIQICYIVEKQGHGIYVYIYLLHTSHKGICV